jgi:hypothetical protein
VSQNTNISTATEVEIMPETTDTRPEPPKMPDLWTVRSFMWLDGPNAQWWPMVWSGILSQEGAQETASRRMAHGDRRVQIIKIGGDA